MDAAVVQTCAGKVRGLDLDGVVSFRGIPFAAAPEGLLRFQLPVPVDAWDGIRDATAFGAAPPQLPPAPGMPAIWRPPDGLDCLTVNVWTPEPGATGLPVMVWIYGGAWKTGSSSNPSYDATKLARYGVVVVTFNYRVGFEGFGQLPGMPANRGLHDQIAALDWVQHNITAFGGDPGAVTIFGESAGAGSVALLVAAPSTRGLFRRAIAQSIPAGLLTSSEAERVTAVLATQAQVPPTSEGFAALAPEAILPIQDAPLRETEARISAFGPVIDGELVTSSPWKAINKDTGRDIELICGFTHDECRLFTENRDLSAIDLAAAATSLHLGHDAVAAYHAAYPDNTDAELFTVMLSDALFRMPSTWMAEAHAHAGGRTWLYDFTWQSPLLGACHALDVPFTFGNANTPLAARLVGCPPPPDFIALAEHIQQAWTTFACTGDPGWPRFDLPHRHTRIWNIPPSTTAYPLTASRRIWEKQMPHLVW